MTGVSFSVDTAAIERASARLAQTLSTGEVAGEIAGQLKSQTKRRLTETKSAPDGTPWAEWSAEYAGTREARHSLLENEGDLEDSIASYADARGAEVGSSEKYAAIHQFGGEEIGIDIPAREYLGIGPDDVREIDRAVDDLFRGAMR